MNSLTVQAWWPLLLLAAVPLLYWLARRHRTALDPRRVALAAALRAGALLCITLALMRPAWLQSDQRVAVVYAIDISRSISSAWLRDALSALARSEGSDGVAQRRYLVFGDHTRLVNRAQDIAEVAVRGEGAVPALADVIDQGATDIESALSAALYAFPADMERHLVLLSDGRQTRGDLWHLLPRLRAQGVRVYTLPAPVAGESDAWVQALEAPAPLRAGAPFVLRAQVHSRLPATARIELRQGERLLGSQSAALNAGTNEVFFDTQLPRPGEQALSVRVEVARDAVPGNDSLTRVFHVQPAPRVLHVGAPDSALAAALNREGLRVQAIDAAALAGQSLGAYDVVVLEDVAPAALGGATAGALETYVRDGGGGLVFVAGEHAYGKSGHAGSALERMLPVKFEGKRPRKDLDLVLLMDRSYSMRGRKLEFAKTAALSILDLLEPHHRLAVVAFDARPHDVVPLAEVGGKRRAEDLISSMTAGGQTHIYGALYYAQRLLEASTTRTRHIILLTDGITAPPPGVDGQRGVTSDEQMELVRRSRKDFFDRWRREHPGQPLPGIDDLPADPPPGTFEEVAAKLKQQHITLSTVALGEKPNLELLANLAQWAEGKAYVAARDDEIPGLFIAEAQRLLGESLIEESFRPLVKVNGAALTGLDFAQAPLLKGFVVSKPKAFADVLLEGTRKLPLLAETRYGLGKTVAFLSDAQRRWAADWLAWPGYGKLWAQVVRDAARRDVGQGLNWEVRREDRDAVITLHAWQADGSQRDGLAPVVRVDDGAAALPLRQSAPGTYTARVPLAATRSSAYHFDLLASGGLGAEEVKQAGGRELQSDAGEEDRAVATDSALLRRLSDATGGVFAPTAEDIRRYRGDGGTRTTQLWWALAAAALLLYLIELFVRRSPWGVRLPASRPVKEDSHVP